MRIAAVKKMWNEDTIHLEKRRGTQEEAIAYCKKNDATSLGCIYEYGKPGRQGQRTDLEEVRQLIVSNVPELEIANEYFTSWCSNRVSFEHYRLLTTAPRNTTVDTYLLVGDPGTGKSHFCATQCPGAYWKQPGTRWWDGYQGQEVVILDDFNGWIPYTDMLRLCDGYPLNVEVKGGQVPMLAKWIIITSNFGPRRWYSNKVYKKHDYRALHRRIGRVYYFTIDPITLNRSHQIMTLDEYQNGWERPITPARDYNRNNDDDFVLGHSTPSPWN